MKDASNFLELQVNMHSLQWDLNKDIKIYDYFICNIYL